MRSALFLWCKVFIPEIIILSFIKLNYTICLSMHILFSGYCYVIIFYSSALLEHCAKDTYYVVFLLYWNHYCELVSQLPNQYIIYENAYLSVTFIKARFYGMEIKQMEVSACKTVCNAWDYAINGFKLWIQPCQANPLQTVHNIYPRLYLQPDS